jgi:hypothetical protein
MSLVWSMLGIFDKSGGTPPPGTVIAGTFPQTNVDLTGGVDNVVIHGKNKKPSSVTFWESDGITPINASYEATDLNTITVKIQDSYLNAIIKYVF